MFSETFWSVMWAAISFTLGVVVVIGLAGTIFAILDLLTTGVVLAFGNVKKPWMEHMTSIQILGTLESLTPISTTDGTDTNWIELTTASLKKLKRMVSGFANTVPELQPCCG